MANQGVRLLNRDAIKYIAVFTMLLNHISAIFLQPGSLLGESFRVIGYFTAVTMVYFLVEGYRYTHSHKETKCVRYRSNIIIPMKYSIEVIIDKPCPQSSKNSFNFFSLDFNSFLYDFYLFF